MILALWAGGLIAGVELSVAGLTLLGFAAAILGIFYPALGLFGIGILCTMDAPMRYVLTNHGGLFRWNTFNYWLLIVLVLYSPFLLRLRNSQFLIWQAFILLLVAQLLYSPGLGSGAQHILNLLSLFALSVYFARTLNSPRAWYWLGLLCGTIGAVGGVVFYWKGAHWIAVSINQWVQLPLTAIFSTLR